MTWFTDHPPVEADLDSCVTCGLCLPACPTFRLTGDETASPRGRLTAIAAVAAGKIEVDARFDEITDFCLQCRACETACPSLVPYGEIIEATRAEVVAQRPTLRRRIDGLILGRAIATPWLLRVASIVAALAQRLKVLRHVPFVGRSTEGLRPIPLPLPTARGGAWGPEDAPAVAMFTGCVADPWFSDVHRATIELLVRAGYRVEAPSGQTCCGALAAHGGHAGQASRLEGINVSVFSRFDRVVVDVAGCGAHLKTYGNHDGSDGLVASKIVDVTEIIAEALEAGRLPVLPSNGERVAIQDPCHLEHGQRVMAPPRAVVAAAGFEPVDADRGGLCCGAAGLYSVEHPETAAELGERKAAKVVAVGAPLVASANAGCEMQLRRHLPGSMTVRHPVEIYAEALRQLTD